MKKRLLMGLAMVCMTGLCAYIGSENNEDTIRGQAAAEVITAAGESLDAKPPAVRNMESEKTEQAASEAAESTEPEADEPLTPPWQISVCPDMPEPYIEVLKQYESYLNACAAATDVDSVQERLKNGEWEYLFYEIGTCTKETNPGDSLCYALKDLTDDGYPELIIAKYASEACPYAVYTYSEEKGVKMFDFKGIPGESGDPEEPITEAEYLQIAEKYAAEPMKLKWNPLVYDKTNPWYSYGEDDDLVFEHDFMSSRDGQGFHWWIYLEATYVMLDYGKRIGYDFMSDHWSVERIWPIEGGYYNILLSQDNHDVVLDLLCQPEDRKYVIVYAQYENGDRRAGYNDAVSFDSQLIWTDFDYNTSETRSSAETPSEVIIENPFRDIYETSICQPCYSALHQYMQDTGYDGDWQIRQVFGRAPFWDYLAESENGLLWVCSDLDYFTYIPF